MKLRKQTGAKAIVLAAMLALLGAFFGLVRSEPRIKAESVAVSEPAVDYESFFAPRGSVPGATRRLAAAHAHAGVVTATSNRQQATSNKAPPPLLPVACCVRAMNSDIELVSYAPDAGQRLRRAQRWLTGFEARFSRFQELSELSRLNASAGRPFVASPLLFELVEKALGLARRSGGLFDPTLLRELIEAGYDQSFEMLPAGRTVKSAQGRPRTSWRDVKLDRRELSITLPDGISIDLGGMGKGYAVDRLAAMLGTPSLVNGGGDVCDSGRPHDAPSWLVGVEDPFAPERDLAVLAVRDRGVATSSTLRRRWRQDGVWQHHLIDPRTRRPSTSDAVQVTVVADSALEAEFQTKVALLLGASEGLRYLDSEPDVEGLIVRSDGRVLTTSGLGAFLPDAARPSRASG